jgi:hypothetical protein
MKIRDDLFLFLFCGCF